MKDDQITYMTNRFLMWKLPKTFSPDGGISFERMAGATGPHPFEREPVGTNLLTYTEAEAMVRHMIAGLHDGEVSDAESRQLQGLADGTHHIAVNGSIQPKQ